MTRQELKEQYKQMKPKMGVYQIKNSVNGKIFIGSNTNLDAIWNRQRLALNFGNHPNTALQQDWKTLGEDQFTFSILSEIKEEEDKKVDYSKEVKQLEQLFLEELQPYDNQGYHKKKG